MTTPTPEDDVKQLINDLQLHDDARLYQEADVLMARAAGELARLLDHIEAQAVRLEAAERLAADRLDQMNADRKQALVWRDQAAKLFESLDGVVGLAVLGAAKITNYKAAIQGAQDLLSKYRAAIASEAKP